MSLYEQLIRKYVYFVPSNVMYKWDLEKDFEEMEKVIDNDYYKYDILGMVVEFEYEGKEEMRPLPRSKRRKLTKRFYKRVAKLRKKYAVK